MTKIDIPWFVIALGLIYAIVFILIFLVLLRLALINIGDDKYPRYKELTLLWAYVCTLGILRIPRRFFPEHSAKHQLANDRPGSTTEPIPASLDYQSIFEFFAKYQVRRIDELEKRVEEADMILRDSIQEVIAKIAEESVS